MAQPISAAPRTITAEVCVYGGTSGGVIAAVQAARMGRTTVLLEPGKHLGGMSAGGLSWTDVGSSERVWVIGGMAREFYQRVGKHYGQDPARVFQQPPSSDPTRSGYDFNNRWAISTDYVGGAHGYPEADAAGRERIARAHEDYLRGFFHFLATSPRVPEPVRREMERFGLCRDEFGDSGGWPHQLYVREARRMVSDFVMTEQHCTGQRVATNSIGLGAYGMDLHAVRRIAHEGRAVNEGTQSRPVPAPYPIGYGAIVPKTAECQNLLVPFALSASHAAFGSIRMEPTFMILSQAAATAASLVLGQSNSVQRVDYAELATRLRSDGQVLSSREGAAPNPGPRLR